MLTQFGEKSSEFFLSVPAVVSFDEIAKADRRLDQLAKLMAAVDPDEFPQAMPVTRQIVGPRADPKNQPIPNLRTDSALRVFDLEVARRLKARTGDQ